VRATLLTDSGGARRGATTEVGAARTEPPRIRPEDRLLHPGWDGQRRAARADGGDREWASFPGSEAGGGARLRRQACAPAVGSPLRLRSPSLGVRSTCSFFERRGLFHRVILSDKNDAQAVNRWLEESGDSLGEFFGFVESDVYVYEHSLCWIDRMLVSMVEDPRLAMLGSQIDKADFVPLESVQDRHDEPLSRQAAELIKANSLERVSPTLAYGELGSPHNPPGRLMLLRTEAIRRTGFASDGVLAKRLESLGYRTAITGSVRHRHLSLLHIFDEPDYDFDRRDTFMRAISKP